MPTTTTTASLQSAVRGASRVRVRGAGSKSAPDETALDLSGLRGIIDYQPNEFIVQAWAGTPVRDVADLLAASGQYLPFDPLLIDSGATLGGTVAANAAGPERFRYGGVRDFLIGCHFIDGRGELLTGGGKVVKNAAGFDYPKLFVGSRGSLGLLNDAEMPAVIHRIFTEMGIGDFVIRINNRRLLQGFYRWLGVSADHIADTLRTVDKLEKIGRDKVIAELVAKVQLAEAVAVQILDFVADDRPVDALLAHLAAQPAMSDELFAQGVSELRAVADGVRSLGVPDSGFVIDLRIARGLGYYTGTVYETKLLAHPELGSICSGGRYDDLASYFTNEKLPGVGISIGLSRVAIALLEAGLLQTDAQTPSRVLVTVLDPARMSDYLRIAADLRAAGVACEVYLEKGRVGDQLKYADRKRIPFALIAGETEFAAGLLKLKNMRTGDETTAALGEIVLLTTADRRPPTAE